MLELKRLVTVHMTRNSVFPWQEANFFTGVLIKEPVATGDVYVVDIGGRRVVLNPNSSDFVGISQLESPDEK